MNENLWRLDLENGMKFLWERAERGIGARNETHISTHKQWEDPGTNIKVTRTRRQKGIERKFAGKWFRSCLVFVSRSFRNLRSSHLRGSILWRERLADIKRVVENLFAILLRQLQIGELINVWRSHFHWTFLFCWISNFSPILFSTLNEQFCFMSKNYFLKFWCQILMLLSTPEILTDTSTMLFVVRCCCCFFPLFQFFCLFFLNHFQGYLIRKLFFFLASYTVRENFYKYFWVKNFF